MLSYTLSEPTGSAPVIVYLHGLGIAGWCWQPTITALPEYGALVPDQPGHGGSGEVAWQSIADTAEKICQIVDQLPAGQRLHLVGHSLGAYVGMVVLTLRPDRFDAAFLSGFHLSSPGKRLLLKLAYVINGMVFGMPLLLRRFGAVFGDPQFARRFVEEARGIRARTIRRAGIQVVDFVPPAGLDALRLPIMAVAGSAEPDGIRRAPEELSKRLPHVDAVVLDGKDHLWPIKEPALYAQMISAFLASRSGADGSLQAPLVLPPGC